jgi:hypothetical protein
MKTRLVVSLCLLSAVLAISADRKQNWTNFVRIGGNSLRMDRVDQIVRGATETNVFGIETDNDIPGRYDSFLDPSEKLKAIKAVAERAHAANNYTFVYIAGLECITANADQKAHSFMKDHPDWVQRKITGEPAVFGGGSAFWIAKGDEDVWISPYAPEWRRIYMERVRQIAATGIDGVYVDIPYWMTHFEGWENTWASFDDYTVEAFKRETKLDARKDIKLGDFRDPGFRRWVDFRIATLTAFMREIDANVKSVNRSCMTIAEIYPGIEEEAVRVGADVYEMYQVVDAIAHEYNFASGGGTAAAKTPLDWLGHLAGVQSFRSFAQGKPSWMLTYSWDGEKGVDRRDAMTNMFMAQVIFGANVWDARGHVMSGSNDLPTRTKVFGWVREHERTFYAPRNPIAPVGVYFSPRTRNYFAAEFVDSYKGTLALMMQSHLEVQVVTPATLQSFGGPVLILPDARCLSSEEIHAIRSLAAAGRSLVVTGETGRYDERGEARSVNPIHQLLGLKRPDQRATGTTGAKFIYDPACPGAAFWRLLAEEFASLAATGKAAGSRFDELRGRYLRELMQVAAFSPAVEVTASPFVTAQIAQVDGKPSVFLANFKGLRSKENATQLPEQNIKISFPGTPGSRIRILPFLGTVRDLELSHRDGRVSCVIPELDKGAVVWIE